MSLAFRRHYPRGPVLQRLRKRKARSSQENFGRGKVVIVANSSLRKLMRAVRRGMCSPERSQVIMTAIVNASRRQEVYAHAGERGRMANRLAMARAIAH